MSKEKHLAVWTPFGARTARMLIAMASDERLSNATHVSQFDAWSGKDG